MENKDKKTLDYLFKHTRGINGTQKEIVFEVYTYFLNSGRKLSDGIGIDFKIFRKKFIKCAYKNFIKYIESLMRARIEITDGERRFEFSYFSSIEINEEPGIIKFVFNEKLEKFLLG